MTGQPFRAIIVGGGPVGLTTAHAFAKAGIDYIVLERRANIVEDVGASIIVFQGSLRVLSQVGLLDRLKTMSVDFSTIQMKTLSEDHHFSTACLRQSKEK